MSFIAENGKVRHLDYELVARSQDGALLSLMRPDLELALFETLPSSVQLRFAKRVEAVDQTADAVTVTYSDGTSDTADVLVGADGIHSSVRTSVFGPEERFMRQLGFHTCAYTLDDPALHQKLQGMWGTTDTVDRMAGLYALRDGRVAMFGAHRVDDVAIAGGRALARELLQSASFSDAFNRYEEQWMPLAASKQAAGRRSAASFLPDSRFSLWMRCAGLRLLQLPGVGRFVSTRIIGERSTR